MYIDMYAGHNQKGKNRITMTRIFHMMYFRFIVSSFNFSLHIKLDDITML